MRHARPWEAVGVLCTWEEHEPLGPRGQTVAASFLPPVTHILMRSPPTKYRVDLYDQYKTGKGRVSHLQNYNIAASTLGALSLCQIPHSREAML